jgi:N-acetylneuraminate synthase
MNLINHHHKDGILASTEDVSRCLIIGEVAQAHDGSVGMAHAYIDAIANAGADVVKFQTHIAKAESTKAEPWRIKFSQQDPTRYDYWKRMEFTEEQWSGLKKHADERGLKFLSSPFSVEAVNLLLRVGVTAWKIASGELIDAPMLEHLLNTNLPIIVSSGMNSLTELDSVVARVKAKRLPLTVLQCTSIYPCPPEKIGLNLIPFFRERYGCGVGLSDHSGTIFAGLAAATVGIEVLEVHITLSREMFGPDISSSITTSELRQLVRGVRFIETMKASSVQKDEIVKELEPIRALFTKSIVARGDLPAGTILEKKDLDAKKPGTGIPSNRIGNILGKRLKRPIKANEMIGEDDLEEQRT